MTDDPLTRWIEKILLVTSAVLIAAFVLIWLTGCYKPVFQTTLYESHTHTSPPVNPSGLNSNETRGGDVFLKGELDELSQRIQDDLGRNSSDADRPGTGR